MRTPSSATATEDLQRVPDGKVHFVRVVTERAGDGTLHVRSAGAQGSHQLRSMADGDALAVLGDGHGARAGDPVEVIVFDPR